MVPGFAVSWGEGEVTGMQGVIVLADADGSLVIVHVQGMGFCAIEVMKVAIIERKTAGDHYLGTGVDRPRE